MAKTYYHGGKWIDSPKELIVSVCHCSNKYIKTREAQIECLRCIKLRNAR